MTTSVKTRNTGSRGKTIAATVPEVSDADREVIAGEPDADASAERCDTCRGHGLVRGVGKNAGGHYRTTNGAQLAQEGGRAKDCPACEGTGLNVPAPF